MLVRRFGERKNIGMQKGFEQIFRLSEAFFICFYSSENIGKYRRHSQPMAVTAATFRIVSFKPSRICSPASRP